MIRDMLVDYLIGVGFYIEDDYRGQARGSQMVDMRHRFSPVRFYIHDGYIGLYCRDGEGDSCIAFDLSNDSDAAMRQIRGLLAFLQIPA